MNRESLQSLMERRAVALARPLEDATTVSTNDDAVIVSVAGGTRYALESRYVQRVVRNVGLCRLPASDCELVGLILVRGEAVPVADLAAVLGLAGADPGRPFVVVLDGESSPLGLLVDEVVTTASLSHAGLRRTDGAVADGTALEVAITRDGVVLVDGRLLLTDDRLHLAADRRTPSSRPTHP